MPDRIWNELICSAGIRFILGIACAIQERPQIDLRHNESVAVSLLTFKRKDPKDTVSVADSVWSINRRLERRYPDCTCSVLVVADSGKASEWVTIELETMHESLACLDWYRKEAEAHGLALANWKPGQGVALKSEVTSALPSPRTA